MIRIYEVYVDLLVLKNLILNQAALIFLHQIMNKKMNFARIFVASLSGAVLHVVFICIYSKNTVLLFLTLLIGLCLMLRISMKVMRCWELFYGVIYYMTIVSALICTRKVFYCFPTVNIQVMESGIFLAGIGICFFLKKGKCEERSPIYQVTIYAYGEKVNINALLDTGNSLREKDTGNMIMIVEKEEVEQILKHVAWEDYHFIPFHSVGQEQGILAAIKVDQIRVTKEEETKIIYEVLLGIYTGNLSSDHSFQMILHKDCLKRRKENGNHLARLFTQTYESWQTQKCK